MADLPRWFRVAVLAVLVGLLVFNLAWDATHADYEGAGSTLGILAILGAAIGVDQLRRGGGGE